MTADGLPATREGAVSAVERYEAISGPLRHLATAHVPLGVSDAALAKLEAELHYEKLSNRHVEAQAIERAIKAEAELAASKHALGVSIARAERAEARAKRYEVALNEDEAELAAVEAHLKTAEELLMAFHDRWHEENEDPLHDERTDLCARFDKYFVLDREGE